MPFHALSHSERATYQARKKLLEHIGNILRTKAVEREKTRMDDEISSGRRSKYWLNKIKYWFDEMF